MPVQIDIDREAVERFCEENHIRKLSLFGSVLTDEFAADSDVDVLVEFEPGAERGLMGLVQLEIDLSRLLGREVDLHTPEDLRAVVRERVLPQAEVLYAA